MKPATDALFKNVMINADNQAVRANRLQLWPISARCLSIGSRLQLGSAVIPNANDCSRPRRRY